MRTVLIAAAIICAAILAATAAPSPAIIDEEAVKQNIINDKVAHAGIIPVGNMPEMYVRKVWSDVPGEQMLWIQSISNLSYPIFPIGKYDEIEKNQTALEIGGTIRTERNGAVRTILSDGENIIVLDQGEIVFTAPAVQYNFVPSNSTLGTLQLNNVK